MKKTAGSIAAVVALVLTLAGCGSSGTISANGNWSSQPTASAQSAPANPATQAPQAAPLAQAPTVPQQPPQDDQQASGNNGGQLYTETSDNSAGTPVFATPRFDSVPGNVAQRIPVGVAVKVACFTANTTHQTVSVSGFYRLVGGPWDGYWAVSDTMDNGGPYAVDKRVPVC